MVIPSGSYTATAGIPEIVHRISEFITKRDGGAPSDPENIYISPGSQWALRVIITEILPYCVCSSCGSSSSLSWINLFLCLLEHSQRLGEQPGFPQNRCADSRAMLPPHQFYNKRVGRSYCPVLPQRGAGLGAARGGAASSAGLCKGTLQPCRSVCHQPWKSHR